MDNNWFAVNRSLFDNEVWEIKPFSKGQAWIDLFGNANHKDNSISIRGNLITIKRGQLGWSELTMSKRWGWSKNKTRRFLKWLETKQQIRQQKNFITTIITIINYEQYQPQDSKTIQQTIQQKDSRRYTNNNDNNDNKEKNNTYGEQFLLEWNKEFKTKFRAVEPIRDNLNYWLKSYSLEEIVSSIRGIKFDDYWKDKDVGPEWLLRTKDNNGPVDRIGRMLGNIKKDSVINLTKQNANSPASI